MNEKLVELYEIMFLHWNSMEYDEFLTVNSHHFLCGKFDVSLFDDDINNNEIENLFDTKKNMKLQQL